LIDEDVMRAHKYADLKDILKCIGPYLEQVDVVIKSKLETGIGLLDEGSWHTFRKSGKKIRASLIILSSGLKNSIPDDIVDIASAAEIIHAASLVHDDIIDKSDMRRGQATVTKKYGSKVAVLVGDFMYTRALEMAVSNNRMDLFPIMVDATLNMVKGELYQIEYSNIDNISMKHYFEIIEMKTARFMGACAKLGGVLSGMDEPELDLMFKSGLNLGYAFQIIDDTIDYVDNTISGKDTGNDFINGKITLPLLHLIDVVDSEDARLIRDYTREPDKEKWEYVIKRVNETDTIDYCVGVAKEYITKAVDYIDRFPESECKKAMKDLAIFLLARNF